MLLGKLYKITPMLCELAFLCARLSYDDHSIRIAKLLVGIQTYCACHYILFFYEITSKLSLL